MTVDAELVTRKLLLMSGDLDLLRAIHVRGLEAYVANRIEHAVVERLLERIVTRVIDVNHHLITAAGHPPPSDYHASFQQLGRLGILDTPLVTALLDGGWLRPPATPSAAPGESL